MSDNIYKITYDALINSTYPVIKEGTVSEDKLPDTYITYMTYHDAAAFYANNEPVDEVYTLRVNLYSKKPTIAQNARTILENCLKSKGFTKQAGGKDLPFSQKTQHHGYSCDYEYYKEK